MGVTDFLLLSCLGFAIAANEIVHNGTEPGINCEEPHVEHGYADAQPPYRPNDKVKFECSTGYKIKGNPTMSCEADGNWLNPPPTYLGWKCFSQNSKVEGKKVEEPIKIILEKLFQVKKTGDKTT
ncbi:C4b-binding protein beta chain-like isoform X4 [Sparus aurata]|uniref:C4b-binding protein beta chain-like isoform X4 n=1 Tax=Sparus aurata TaxID=8175 RepID=UPI0011C1268F|nr:C4b-binding protein beta chain-like isoform X4 [Sparus aurata]